MFYFKNTKGDTVQAEQIALSTRDENCTMLLRSAKLHSVTSPTSAKVKQPFDVVLRCDKAIVKPAIYNEAGVGISVSGLTVEEDEDGNVLRFKTEISSAGKRKLEIHGKYKNGTVTDEKIITEINMTK